MSPPETAPEKGERIAKRLARAGLCSRREAERWIAEGRVAVDGRTLDTPAVTVDDASVITVDGKPLPAPEPPRLFRYHKPRGLLTTHRDPERRPTLFERLPEGLPRLIAVGRLDLDSEGLLLLTNDGELARALELPATGWLRRYRVRAFGRVEPARLATLAKGITIDGVHYGAIEATLDRTQGANQWLSLGLREGKNREVRRVLEHLGLSVNRLIRTGYGPFQLGTLARGAIEEVPRGLLRDQLGGIYRALKHRPRAEGRHRLTVATAADHHPPSPTAEGRRPPAKARHPARRATAPHRGPSANARHRG